jgi:hypothetical protein
VARQWSELMYFLAGDDILNIEKISKLSIITCFNYMAYRKDKARKQKLKDQTIKKFI